MAAVVVRSFVVSCANVRVDVRERSVMIPNRLIKVSILKKEKDDDDDDEIILHTCCFYA